MSQQAPISHRNRWRSEGLREESGTEKSLQLAGKQLHSNSTATVYQPITLSGNVRIRVGIHTETPSRIFVHAEIET